MIFEYGRMPNGNASKNAPTLNNFYRSMVGLAKSTLLQTNCFKFGGNPLENDRMAPILVWWNLALKIFSAKFHLICFVNSSQKQWGRTYFFMQTLPLWLKPPSCIVQFVRNKFCMAGAVFVFKLRMSDFGMIFAYLSPKQQLKLNFFIVLKLSSDSAPQN